MSSRGRIKRQSIVPRLDGIQRDIARLQRLAQLPLKTFMADEDTFALAQFYLRQALEGVFHISEHILSHRDGGRAREYKEIARKLGEQGIIDQSFANEQLVKMAGYRNRLTHFYADITPQEMYQILHEDLADFRAFEQAIKRILENPQKYELTLEE